MAYSDNYKCLPMHVFAKNARVAWNGKEVRLKTVN